MVVDVEGHRAAGGRGEVGVDVLRRGGKTPAERVAAFLQAATIAAAARRDARLRGALIGLPHVDPLPTNKPRILSQRIGAAARMTARLLSPGQALAIVVLGLAGVAAFGITPDTTLDSLSVRTISRALPLPPLAKADAGVDRYWREERVQRGDTIGSLLARAEVTDASAMEFMRNDPSARALYQLRPGRPLYVATDDDGRLAGLRFLAGNGELLSIARTASGYVATREAPPDDVRVTLRAGTIDSSLFAAADDAGLPDAITLALADVFGGDIDFYHDLRRGDHFAVLYETRYVDGEPAGTGRILAAEFVNSGVTLRAFLWHTPDGGTSYYNDDGRSSRKAFLRSPMEFSRITSGFTMARLHPVLHSMRAHKGTDFAAPIGTPVRTTADGVVTFAGEQNGYGNVIIVKHDGRYSTVYAHLSRFADGVRDGDRVHQGDTIGFVGQTGWATGPHLHYELRVDGEARDPMTVALPVATPVSDTERAAFAAAIAPLAGELAVVRNLPERLIAAE
jgi:murein DD-endopeptidase MepM/ murein hydrolase activator NlpD